jgi:hypothetical protein
MGIYCLTLPYQFVKILVQNRKQYAKQHSK